MNNFRPLTINERYFSQFLPNHGSQNFGNYQIDGIPDTTATFSDINVPEVKSTEGFVLKNKHLLIAGSVILIVVAGVLIYSHWQDQKDDQYRRNKLIPV